MRESPQDITIPIRSASLYGMLALPPGATGIVVFAHGSGSSRFSPRNHEVAAALQQAGFATLLFDLLTESEEAVDRRTRQHRFDIPLLGERLIAATDWLSDQAATGEMNIGYFGASTGAAAALIAAADRPNVHAVVSRGGRPDLAGEALGRVRSPTLLIVGELDTAVIEMNTRAKAKLGGPSEMVIVPGATHLFEEPGTMEQVTKHAEGWFQRYLASGEQMASE
ncbi:MAG TPA: alpha/beta family hydrolase [Thermomicrobiales bacterium]|nr:alpha/beta family hydrolase [Thermomicrobiales bacterium]